MPAHDKKDCPEVETDIVLRHGYFEERCSVCGKLVDCWKADKDLGGPEERGPA